MGLKEKMQVNILKNTEGKVWLDYGDDIVLTDLYVGVFMRKEECLLDLTKIKREESNELVAPSGFNENDFMRIRAGEEAIIKGKKIYVRLENGLGEDIWADKEYLKCFEDCFFFKRPKEHIVFAKSGNKLTGFFVTTKMRSREVREGQAAE